jgi:uncharacterized repeat protein (TIGR01451 family)
MKKIIMMLLFLVMFQAAQACTSGGCISAGPRLASVSSTRGPLLNALLGGLTGSTVNLTVADWNTLATSDVSLLKTVNALQNTLNVSTPSSALNTNATVAQIIGAMATAAQQEGQTSLAASLNSLAPQLSVSSPIKLGDLLVSDGVLGTTRINALNLVTGTVQLYNTKNVLTTPTPIGISGTALGLSGILNNVSLSVQVVEPPVYVCGPVGSTFHTASIRVKLDLDLVTLTGDSSLLNALPGVSGAVVKVLQLGLYLEIARADGTLTAVDAINNALTVQVTPGVADLYLGTMSDSVFFNRSHVLNAATDLGYANIGTLKVGVVTVSLLAKSSARGQAPSASQLSFTGAGLQTRTAYSGAAFTTNLLSSLITNLQVSITPSLGLLDAVVLPVLKTVVGVTVSPILGTVLSSVVDPLLELIGVRLGEVDVTSGGAILMCSITGTVYNDANHSTRQDNGETGTGVTLYAKLISTATPSVAISVVSVNTTTGSYQFTSVLPDAYNIVIGTTNSTSVVTPAAPSGWIATEVPTLSRSLTMSGLDLAGQTFGIYHGSQITGIVFKDNGVGTGGIAHNGIKDGTETFILGSTVKITDATGSTVFDTTRSDATGDYTLWVPYTSGAIPLKVTQATQPNDPAWVPVSGSVGNTAGTYTLATNTLGFTNVIGTIYTGANFGDVAPNRFETDGQQTIAAGTVALFSHAFTSGTSGQITLTPTASLAASTGWSNTLHIDANCNGQLDAGDAIITAPISAVVDQKICIIAKVFAPVTAPNNTEYTLSLSASFAYSNISLTNAIQRQDLTLVGTPTESGLKLVKTVDKNTASSGEVIVYTIAYTNNSKATVSALKINDATPSYTVFASAACGTLPTGITACNVTTAPAVNAKGALEWTFTGALSSGASGSVQFSVKVE